MAKLLDKAFRVQVAGLLCLLLLLITQLTVGRHAAKRRRAGGGAGAYNRSSGRARLNARAGLAVGSL